jgi:hypothetical protein
MLSFLRAAKYYAAIIGAAVILAGAPSQSNADTGTVRLKVTSRFIVGVGGARTLT